MKKDLTTGNVTSKMLLFAGPMILGNLLQQFYNIADTLIVSRFIGSDALASVGSAYTLMTFLTSILIGLCMGSAALFSFYYGKQDHIHMKQSMRIAFVLIGSITILLNAVVFIWMHPILKLLRIPDELMNMMTDYIRIIFCGMIFVFLYNYYAYLLRSVGNSVVPLCFLGVSSILNVGLDLLFVISFHWGVSGAAIATVIAQGLSGIGIAFYTMWKEPKLRLHLLTEEAAKELKDKNAVKEMLRFSTTSCMQQSVMNFGILMIQGLVNSFGAAVMAAFAAAVKIDTFAYMPAQEFGNAFSMFISQNYGAERKDRIHKGVKSAVAVSAAFCVLISFLVYLFADKLMLIFVKAEESNIITIGAGYLHIEGACYCGIGILFLLYGYYRGINKPEMSLILTIISLGTRVILAYLLAPIGSIGVYGIWWAIPIGWLLADLTGLLYMYKKR